MNTLYYGDNLDILREYIKDESVDLIYLDPPFNSNRNYNVLFKNESGVEAESQITAFEDTWHWSGAVSTYFELIKSPDRVGQMIQSFHDFLGENQMMAYLVMMAIRLKELHRVLKPTGSLYLHCDPTASHYLKILLDTIFGAQNYKNEITWKRTSAHSSAKRYGSNADIIFFYTKSELYTWNQIFTEFSDSHLKKFSRVDPDGRRWYDDNLTGAGTTNGDSGEDWRGFSVRALGRHWRTTRDELERLDSEGKIYFPKDGFPRLKRFLDEAKGVAAQEIWDDIFPINSQAKEKLGYPTQKPVALLERIISASSNEGDVVLDPFCGCGTTIAAAQKLNRQWIGIDVTHLAVGLMKYRLRQQFGILPYTGKLSFMPSGLSGEIPAGKRSAESGLIETQGYRVIGQPTDLDGARKLAEEDKYGFQWWILPLIGAKAFGSEAGKKEGKKGADKGVDGMMVFADDNSGKAKKVIVSVKGGQNVSVSQIRDLGHVIDRENAAIGVYVTLEKPTKPMIEEAAGKGFYHSPGWNKDYPRLQILTVEDILNGAQVNLPPNIDTFKQAQKVVAESDDQGKLGFE